MSNPRIRQLRPPPTPMPSDGSTPRTPAPPLIFMLLTIVCVAAAVVAVFFAGFQAGLVFRG